MNFWRRCRAARAIVAAGLALAAGACGRAEVAGAETGEPVKAERPGVEPAAARAERPGVEAAAVKAGRAGVELVAASGDEPVEAIVRREAGRARAAGRSLVVYLGAPWCEPCVRFHDAVQAGSLDAELPALTVLEFDYDRDADRLRAAGYDWKYVPLFARPGPDGRASGRSIEGSIKGEGAVAQIVPRLKGLLAR